MLALQAEGAKVTTIEGLAKNGGCIRCRRRSASITGCSAASARPGMIMSAIDLVKRNPDPSEQEIRE